MTRRPVSRRRAAHEAALATLLLLAVVLVGANFVLVEVRFFGLAFQTRLGWVILVALALGFCAGALGARRAR